MRPGNIKLKSFGTLCCLRGFSRWQLFTQTCCSGAGMAEGRRSAEKGKWKKKNKKGFRGRFKATIFALIHLQFSI